MSEGLDFSDLTDDQIVELATGLAREALMRNPAVAAAFNKALLSEKERADAALRGAKAGRLSQATEIHEIHKRAAEAQGREELRQKREAAAAVFVRQAAQIVDRDLSDITMIWTASYSKTGHRIYINQGLETGVVGVAHLFEYCTRTEQVRTSWKLAGKRQALIAWGRETCAALEALGLHNITIKGIEL